MKAVEITLDDSLVKALDRAAKKLRTTRSAFTREALRSALKELRVRELESKHREGYRRKPVKRGEFSGWESEQVRGDLVSLAGCNRYGRVYFSFWDFRGEGRGAVEFELCNLGKSHTPVTPVE